MAIAGNGFTPYLLNDSTQQINVGILSWDTNYQAQMIMHQDLAVFPMLVGKRRKEREEDNQQQDGWMDWIIVAMGALLENRLGTDHQRENLGSG